MGWDTRVQRTGSIQAKSKAAGTRADSSQMSESRFSSGKQKELGERQELRCADPPHPQLEAFHALPYSTLKKSPVGTAISFTVDGQRLREGFIEATSPTLHAPPTPNPG